MSSATDTSKLTRRSLVGAGACAALRGAPARRPNVIIVMMDDFGYGQFAPNAAAITQKDYDPAFVDFLARHGGDSPEVGLEFARRAMPTMSALAQQGVVFTNAFSSSNLCAPARVGVLTGVQQNRYGFYQNEDVERVGMPKGSALAGRLQQGGYATALVGKYHAGTRDESLRLGVLKKYGLAPGALMKMDPAKRAEVDAEIRKTGYLGSTIPEHNPLNHGFDYYFGYNRWERSEERRVGKECRFRWAPYH